MTSAPPPPPVHAEPRRRRRGPWGLVVAGVGAALIGLTVWVLVDAAVARSAMSAAAVEVQSLQDQVIAGEDVTATVAALQAHTARAVAATDGPEWWVAAHLPWLGPTFGGGAVVADVVDSLAHEALPQMVDARESVDPATLAPVDGRVDLQPLIDAAPAVIAADRALQQARARIAELDTGAMLGSVAGPVAALAVQVDQVAMTTATASRAVQLLPAMLGADGPRTYAILVQGNSEIRSLGGMPGVTVLVTAEDGVVRFGSSLAAAELTFNEPVLPLTQEEVDLYSEIIGLYMSDVTMTPDFPRTAELAQAMVERKTGTVVDGVAAVDPVLLQSVLSATGAVAVPGGPALDGSNAADYLLNGIYLDVPSEPDQNAYFAAAARAVFEALVSGAGEPQGVMDSLAGPARDGRLLVWSADPEEQALLAGTVLSGELKGADGESPEIGVFLNSGAAAKIDAYLDYSVRAEQTGCTSDGRRVFDVSVTLTSTVPQDFERLPVYAKGTGEYAPAGTIRTNVAVYAPAGGWLESAAIDGEDSGVAPFVHDGLTVGLQAIDLAPGASSTLVVSTVTGNDQLAELRMRVTPGPHAVNTEIIDFSCGA